MDRYYEGGISSVYMWEDENEGFIACFLIKKGNDFLVVKWCNYFLSNPEMVFCWLKMARRLHTVKEVIYKKDLGMQYM